MSVDIVLSDLQKMANPENVEKKKHFGIETSSSLGITNADLKLYAKNYKKQHDLALKLWKTGIHEARMLCCWVDDPKKITEQQMENWVKDFDSWDITDGICGQLFYNTPFAYKKAYEWATTRTETFEKRAGFVLMAWLALKDKKAPDTQILDFLPIIEQHAWDERNFVKKAVNWALRQIGKRNIFCNKKAIISCKKLLEQNTKSANWIAKNALAEIQSPKVIERLVAKEDKIKNL